MSEKEKSDVANSLPSLKRVNFPDPSDLELGHLWIMTTAGTFVNMAASPEMFDKTILEYIDLMDRKTWPTTHRIAAINMAEGDVPVYWIPPKDLTGDMKEEYDKIVKPVEMPLEGE